MLATSTDAPGALRAGAGLRNIPLIPSQEIKFSFETQLQRRELALTGSVLWGPTFYRLIDQVNEKQTREAEVLIQKDSLCKCMGIFI